MDGGIVYWRSIEALGILWRATISKKFLLSSVLVISKIQRWNIFWLLWNF